MATIGEASAAVARGNSTSSASRNELAENMDTFMTLLTTQLKFQDPLSPMDSSEFTNQLVQFAQVEQQINQNENLENLLALNAGTQQAMAVSYIGKYVEAETEWLSLQDSKAMFTYGLSEAADNVVIGIYDADDNLVRSYVGERTPGLHSISWDGKDKNDVQMEDGAYRIKVTAVSREEGEVETWTTSLGKVTGVASSDDGTMLGIGGITVYLDNVLGVFDEMPEPAADDSTDSTDSTDPGDGADGDSTGGSDETTDTTGGSDETTDTTDGGESTDDDNSDSTDTTTT